MKEEGWKGVQVKGLKREKRGKGPRKGGGGGGGRPLIISPRIPAVRSSLLVG